MSSQEALDAFMKNPRPYLLSPLPKIPCKLSVLGPPGSGKTTLSNTIASKLNAKVSNLNT